MLAGVEEMLVPPGEEQTVNSASMTPRLLSYPAVCPTHRSTPRSLEVGFGHNQSKGALSNEPQWDLGQRLGLGSQVGGQ